MKKKLFAVLFSLVSVCLQAQEDPVLRSLTGEYTSAVSGFMVPRLQLGYLENLNGILDDVSRNAQQERFATLSEELRKLDYAGLAKEDQYHYQHLDYVLELQLRRIDLENRFRLAVPGKVDATTGIFNQPLGTEWYRYFLDRWLSVKTTPEELFVFGESEVLKVQREIRAVQEATGYGTDEAAFYRYLDDDALMLTNEAEIIESYQSRKARVQEHLGELFSSLTVPDVNIEPFPESNKDTVPGQLMESMTFRFNFFEQRHNIQDMDFLYLHEVVPGHAFHLQYNQDFPHADYPLTSLGAYAGHLEGWGAYVEELGEELGLYQTPWLKMGKLKFDLVRSARVALDIGINYYGWDNQQALDYWFAHIKGQDDIAQREIDRVRRWPGQAISYKVGAATLLELKSAAREQLGAGFDIREFHHRVLAYGAVPLFLVERRLRDYIQAG